MKARQLGILFLIALLMGISSVQINAKVINSNTPTDIRDPKLICNGEIVFTNVRPGVVYSDVVSVKNSGKEGSYLNWDIPVSAHPNFGKWTFEPSVGKNLAYGEVKSIIVSVVLSSNEKNQVKTGLITIYNSDNRNDSCSVDVYVSSCKTHNLQYYHFLEILMERFPILYSIFNPIWQI